ncbi:MAG: hypothetical protein ACFB0G_11315 [Leptolyngbyaceae cyanobacterium]
MGLASLGEVWFLNMNWPMINGLWLFGAAGVCVGWEIEKNLNVTARNRFLSEVERLTGIESLPDDERAALEMLRKRLEDFHNADIQD